MGKLIFEESDELGEKDVVLVCINNTDIKVVFPSGKNNFSEMCFSQTVFLAYAIRMSVRSIDNDVWIEELIEYISKSLANDLDGLGNQMNKEVPNDGDTRSD
jgi:hypothetical protein